MAPTFDRRHLFRASGAALGVVATGLVHGGLRRAHAADNNGPIRLVANENPYGPSASAQEAMANALADGWMYATTEARVLRGLIAEREGVEPSNVLITAGSGELLKMAGLGFGQTGDVVAARPTFSMLVGYVRNTGGTVHEINLDKNMIHDLAAMEGRISDNTSLVYVCNPNNPTGTLSDADTLRSFIDTVESRTTVFVDEAYVDLLEDPSSNAMVDQVKAGKNVIIARTFSKIHGMAGLRIGYAIAREDLIKRLRPLQMSFLNVMGLRAAVASYKDIEFQEFSKSKIQECVSITQSAFEDLGLPYTPSKGNFVLFDTGGSVRAFSTAMRRKNILVGRSYAPYESWCRVSMGTVEQMAVFAEALREYYKG
ncbi:MAG: histidinol-phosphate transaminase [Rhodospirillaceae bacterium]|nr:histidinol-phosphate transaminase [Rhodospirillaceae bacterium]